MRDFLSTLAHGKPSALQMDQSTGFKSRSSFNQSVRGGHFSPFGQMLQKSLRFESGSFSTLENINARPFVHEEPLIERQISDVHRKSV